MKAPSSKALSSIWLVALLCACNGGGQTVGIETSVDNEAFQVAISNNSGEVVVVHERVLGLGTDSPVGLEVSTQEGDAVRRCRDVDYVHGGGSTVIRDGEEGFISIPISAISLAHCLEKQDKYSARFSLRTENSVHWSDWVEFTATWAE